MDERQLQEIFARCDVGWMFREDAATSAQRVFMEMHAVERHYEERFGCPLVPTLADRILREVERYKPLVQTFASPMTATMRTMVFGILDGAQVMSISFEYKFKNRAHMEVQLEYESGEIELFTSDELWDAEVLRHFGLMKLGNAPVVDGYYSFRKEPPA